MRGMRARLFACVLALALDTASCGGRTDNNELDRSDLVQGQPASAVSDSTNPMPTEQGLYSELASSDGDGATSGPANPTSPGADPAAGRAPAPDDPIMVAAASAPSEAEIQPQPEKVVTTSFGVDDVTMCSIWLDVPTSPLLPEDLTVAFDGEPWLTTSSCNAGPEWYLNTDDSGLWLTLCPIACDLMLASPSGQLTVEAVYWTEVTGSVAR